MKKYTFFFFFTQFAINCFSQTSGQLKISIESFKCINKSWDGLIEFDGPGNEVSVTYSYRIYNPSNTGAARRGADGTVIYGANINGMTRAGTETPDHGGITNGNVVPVYKTLMNEHINANDYIIIAPTVWEWDAPEKNTINNFNVQLENDLNWVITQPYPFLINPVTYSDPFNGRVVKINNAFGYGQALKYHNIFKNIFCPLQTQGNRVIGIDAGDFNNECLVVYSPTLLVLDTKVLWGLYMNNYTATHPQPGTSHAATESRTDFINGVNIPFKENTYAIETSNGSYSVFLRIEFTPDVQSTPPQPSPAPKYTKQPLINKFPNQPINTIKGNPSASYTMNNELLYGQWKGIIGANSDTKSSPFLFKINNNVFWLLDNNGSSMASGGFKIENNNFTSTYYYPNGDNFTILSASYNPSTGELSGTWSGNGVNANKKGNWLAVKQSN